MSGKAGWRVVISFLVAFAQATWVLPAISDGGSITRFSDGGDSATALLDAAGNVTFANLSVPAGTLLMNG